MLIQQLKRVEHELLGVALAEQIPGAGEVMGSTNEEITSSTESKPTGNSISTSKEAEKSKIGVSASKTGLWYKCKCWVKALKSGENARACT